MNNYRYENIGQEEFFDSFIKRVDKSLTLNDIIIENTDGVINGNLIEFKRNVVNLNAALFQAIKYLSSFRIKGISVPATILIIDLNAKKAWRYNSEDYLQEIESIYIGAASKNNNDFIGKTPSEVIEYGDTVAAEHLVSILKEKNYTRIHIDENCIVGWANRFYREVTNSRKEDFIGDDSGKHKTIGEIRNPVHFVNYIYPYTGKTNVRFSYLMDKLNDTIQKKNLGAFYTHSLYAEKSLELVRKAIALVPKGNDYVIIDRCAGTGNLEACLSDEELEHCIVSTIEYYEYKVLQELIGSKVRHLIPPIETDSTFNAGLVSGCDALSREYIEHPIIKQYVDNPKCTIILFENPPYAETTSVEHQKKGLGKKSSAWKHSYVVSEMKKEVSGTASNDLGNAFIWSAFKYYLRQPTDSYIVYSPVKYWKVHHLINKQFGGGFAYNRKHFHTNIEACIMVALWQNTPSVIAEIQLDAYDIKDNALEYCGKLDVRRIFKKYSREYYDKRVDANDVPCEDLLGYDGLPASLTVKKSLNPVYNDNIIGYMVIDGANFDNPDLMSVLIRCGLYKGHGYYLRADNYLEKLPMFCASRYITYNRKWTERARIMKAADGATRFRKDVESGELDVFLHKCLMFTCMEMQNHIRTLIGQDGRFYRNELCLDTTHGPTHASEELSGLQADTLENSLLSQWNTILECAKECNEYDETLTYGVYQIYAELDTFYKDENTGDAIYNNIELHSALQGLKPLVREYYNTEIVPTLFEYEFLK